MHTARARTKRKQKEGEINFLQATTHHAFPFSVQIQSHFGQKTAVVKAQQPLAYFIALLPTVGKVDMGILRRQKRVRPRTDKLLARPVICSDFGERKSVWIISMEIINNRGCSQRYMLVTWLSLFKATLVLSTPHT